MGPGPGPGFSLQQIKSLLAVAVLGTCVRVAAESESFQVEASGSKVAAECPASQSQETLLKKFFQQTVGRLHWTVSLV